MSMVPKAHLLSCGDAPGRRAEAERARRSGICRLHLLLWLNVSYCGTQLFAASQVHSLAMLSDAFHTLSDVVAIGIALWCERARTRARSSVMTYGWARAEVLGGLTSAGCTCRTRFVTVRVSCCVAL